MPAHHGPAIPQKGWSATPVVIARIKAAWGALALLLEERQRGENKQFGKALGTFGRVAGSGKDFAGVSCALGLGWGHLAPASDALAADTYNKCIF